MIMKMNLYCILCLFLTVFSSACGNEKIDGNKTKQVTLTITPSDEIIVEGKGGSVSFTVTPSDPTVALKYVPSVEWVKATSGTKETLWNIATNTSKLSREGYIYILDNASLVQLGKITRR